MHLVLVGADFEENLGLGMIAAAAGAAGHDVGIVPFNVADERASVVSRVLALRPDVVGLSIQFQHRAAEFLGLARALRVAGFAGHLTCGGQFPTLAWNEVLGRACGVDSIVLHEGEATIVELLEAIDRGRPLADVAGLAVRPGGGAAVRTRARPLAADLDRLPFARRYRPHDRHMGIPFVPILGSRGCWGACSYCSITSFYRDARAFGGGRALRMRGVDNLADEMARLAEGAGGRALFCFHDDNLLLPRPEATLARLSLLRRALDARDVGPVGIIGKCRPDTLTRELARELAVLGVVRLYVGVENAAQRGADHLNRRTQTARVQEALDACEEARIFVCYNLLVFEPDATIEDVRDNVAFIRRNARHPINFCRAEPYSGTPLQLGLEARGNLGGSYLGWNYRIADERTELLFRICAAAFRNRNFAPEGVGNRYMGLGYSAKVLDRFYDEPGRFARRARELTEAIALETADFLEEAIGVAEEPTPAGRDAVEQKTALLGLRIAAADQVRLAQIDDLYEDMNAFVAARARAAEPRRRPGALTQFAQSAALGASLAIGAGACCRSQAVDPVPPDSGDATDGDVVQDPGWEAVDPPPPDGGMDLPDIVDPPPPDAAMDAPDVVVDPPPADAALDAPAMGAFDPARPIDQWRDTAPRRAVRSRDLPLCDPPAVVLVPSSEPGGVRVRLDLQGGPASVTTRWEADGPIVVTDPVSGREVVWRPASATDQLRVAVRSRGGVAVAALRARDAGG